MELKRFETLLDVADFLENMDNSTTAERGFSMEVFVVNDGDDPFHPCGCASCIGGWVFLANVGNLDDVLFSDDPRDVLEKEFSIPKEDANNIAYPPLSDKGSCGWEASPKQAAKLLRNYVETGIVDWERACA